MKTATIALVAFFIGAGHVLAEFRTDFESGEVQGWKKNSEAVELSSTKGENGSYVLLASGQARNVGASIQCKIPVTEKTMIEFDFRCDAQTPLAYFAFSATAAIQDKPTLFWLYSSGGNALKDPSRNKWHHLAIAATELKTLNGAKLAAGNIITSFSVFQVYTDGGPHCFMIDNFRVYEGQGELKASDVEKFVNRQKPTVNKNLPIERNSADAFPLITVPECNAAPLIDGELDDPCWRNAAGIAALPNFSGGKTTENTRFLLAYDSENLYVGVKAGQCYLDPVLNLLDKTKCKAVKNDGPVYLDDSVEIFLLPGTDVYYQFIVNSDGVVFDGKDKSPAWNSTGLKKAVRKHLREWTAEIAVPFKDIGLSHPLDLSFSDWRANFCRNNPAKDETSAWSPTQKSFHTVSAFGFMKFDRNAPVLQCETIATASGSATMKILCEGRSSPLDISGSSSDMSVNPGERKELELKFKPDSDGIGQIRMTASGKEIFRTASLRVKKKSTELSFTLDAPAVKVFLNGVEASGKTLYLEEDENVIGLEVNDLTKPLEGAFSVGGLEFPIGDFLYSDKAAAGWDKPGFKDDSWKPYIGETGKKFFLRHTLIASCSTFAPQLDNNTYYAANKAAVKLTFRLSSPFTRPLADYKFHLDVPEGITVPCYRQDLRLYNKYKNSMSVKNGSGRNLFAFSFAEPVPRLPYNFGFNVITMVMKPDFPSDAIDQTLKGRVWISGRGVHEIPAEFKIKVMPELDGRQPEKIPVATWPIERERCLATEEMEILPETWRNAGFTAIATNGNCNDNNSYGMLAEFSKTARENHLKTVYVLFGYQDTHLWKDIFDKNPDARFVPMSSVKLTWEKPICPLYMMSSEEMAGRISKVAAVSDYMEDDMERGLAGSCFCPRCRAYFAKENSLPVIPDEKEILSKYKELWIRHQVLMNRKIFEFIMKSAREAKPEIRSAVYNGYADCPPEQYGMDWALYRDVDLPTAGYSESPLIIKQTRKALGGRPICPGLILDTNAWELPYADQNITARLWRQLVAGGFGGVHVWTWNELDGRGLHAVANFTKGVAETEKFLDEKNEISAKGLISGMAEAYAYKKGEEYLYLAINNNLSTKKITVTIPDAFEAKDVATGRKFSGKKDFGVEIAPNDVMLLHVKPSKSFLERFGIF